MLILVKVGQGKCCAFIVAKNAMPVLSNAAIGPTNFEHCSLNQVQLLTQS